VIKPQSHVRATFQNFKVNESGATALEYGLITALIAVAVIGGMIALGGASGGSWDKTAAKSNTAIGN
jgi:pilus assembly protein Flp/PilA